MKVHVGNFKIGALKAVIREKCESINRPQLGNVNGNEIKVLNLLPNEVYICRIRGMTYKVDLDLQHPTLGIFDPVEVMGNKAPFRRCKSSLREDK